MVSKRTVSNRYCTFKHDNYILIESRFYLSVLWLSTDAFLVGASVSGFHFEDIGQIPQNIYEKVTKRVVILTCRK